MPLDRTKLGNAVAEQMEALEHIYGEDENVELGAVLTIVEVIRREGDEIVSSDVRMRFDNAGDGYRIVGLLRAAEQSILKGDGE
jgi:hypothetical protein